MNRNSANKAVAEIRRIRRAIAAKEAAVEERVGKMRDKLAGDTAALRAREKTLAAQLEVFYRDNRKPNQRCIKLQHGMVGERVVPRVEVPKSAIDHVPRRALTVKKTVNKRALKALGKKAMAAAGAREVRPSVFYVRTNDEDAER